MSGQIDINPPVPVKLPPKAPQKSTLNEKSKINVKPKNVPVPEPAVILKNDANKLGEDIELKKGERNMGDYILGKSIGEGTFGKVKVGTHRPTGQKVAIKVLRKSKIIDNADVERVSREIHILRTVQHPHIIQLYEIIETPKTLYLIMEYVSGGELFDFIVQN